MVFVDFRKAFDLVDHGVLLTKLASMGITNARVLEMDTELPIIQNTAG